MRGALLLLMGLALILLPHRAPRSEVGMGPVGRLPIDAPETVDAGERAMIVVGPTDAPEGTEVTLTMIGSYGPRTLSRPLDAGYARFDLTGEQTRSAGRVSLVATAGGARGTGAMTIRAREPVEPLTPLVGARSIVADGRSWAMVVVVPFDRFGNLVAEGTPVRYQLRRPDGRNETATRPVRHGLAWLRVTSGIRAGRSYVAAQAEGAVGPEAVLDEVPDRPTGFALTVDPSSLPANARDLVVVRTSQIVDANGNVVPDGTRVTFIVEDEGAIVALVPAYTIEGRAEARLEAADHPGTVRVRAEAGGAPGAPASLHFSAGPTAGTFPVAVEVTEETVLVTAGPLLGSLDQYVPEDTEVRIGFVRGDGPVEEWRRVPVESGYARLELRRAWLVSGHYLVVARVGADEGRAEFALPEATGGR